LGNGKVLVAGGYSGTAILASAELYDPAAGTFTATGSMTVARRGLTATLLSNGKVLIAGGTSSGQIEASAELYDPAAGTFTATGSMTVGRYLHTSTLLGNGKVLIAGGGYPYTSAELYDPAAGTFTATGSMTERMDSHTATLLGNGKVLMVGGWYITSDNYGEPIETTLASAELFDPVAGTFTATGSMTMARWGHTATLLSNGKVLVAGGENDSGYLASAELYENNPDGGFQP
jgi:hypothetical protein